MAEKSCYGTLRGTIIAVAVGATCVAHAVTFNVLDFGAKGDGKTKDTAAIQKAVDAASKAGGGEVLLPKGVYLSGSVFLKSGVDFHLADGAVLKGSPDPADYNALDIAPQNWGRLGSGDNISGGHLVLCVEQENVTLRGPGKIDGNVGAFLKMPDGSHPPTKLKIPWRPAQMVWFVESRNIAIRDIEIADAPYWSCFFPFAQVRRIAFLHRPNAAPSSSTPSLSCGRFRRYCAIRGNMVKFRRIKQRLN